MVTFSVVEFLELPEIFYLGLISFNTDDQGNTPPKRQTTKKVHITINNIYIFLLKGTGVFGLFKSDFIRVIQLSVQFITQTIFRYRQHKPSKISFYKKHPIFFVSVSNKHYPKQPSYNKNIHFITYDHTKSQPYTTQNNLKISHNFICI